MNAIQSTAIAKSRTPHPQTSPRFNVRRCPSCGGSEVHPSARRGLFEHIALRLKMKAPFLCYACGRRFYDSALI